MQGSKDKVGQHFRWQRDGESKISEAVVTGIRSDHQEGLSPETEEYAAFWIEARPIGQSESPQEEFTIMVGTDGKSYMDGKEVSIHILP